MTKVFRGKIDWSGHVVWGDPQAIAKHTHKLRGRRVMITVEEYPSHDQHKFYRGVLLPAMADGLGYKNLSEAHRTLVLDRIHKQLKRELIPVDPTSMSKKRKYRSTSNLTKKEFSVFIEGVYGLAAELEIVLPLVEPEEKETLVSRPRGSVA